MPFKNLPTWAKIVLVYFLLVPWLVLGCWSYISYEFLRGFLHH